MALGINTNLFSLNAQRNLRKTNQPLQKAMSRLSSGLRINSASDDAAGLAIATRQTRQIKGLSVNIRNANDGISFAQTAEGAMAEMLNSMQRINELAVQSASNNTSSDRGSMDNEVQELIAELNRIVGQTRFNGETFLNQPKSVTMQVGTEVNETITVSTANVSPDSFGVQASQTNFDDTAANRNSLASSLAAMSLRSAGLSDGATIATVDLGASILTSNVVNNSLNVINRVNEKTATHNTTAFSFGNAFVGTAPVAQAAGATDLAVNAGYLTINGISIGSSAAVGTSIAELSSGMVTAINAQTANTGVTAVLLGSADSGAASSYSVALVDTSGAAISVSVATANAGVASQFAAFFGTSGGSAGAGSNGQIIFSTPLGTTSRAINAGSDSLALGIASGTTSVTLGQSQSINDVSVTTVGNANLTILAVKEGLDAVNSERATLGAMMNRLEGTIANLENVRENITASRSRILDADFAQETANLTKALILQQAGISVLSQANSTTQNVLALLQ
ncbi:MAG: flagellin [Nitrospiria bacterium]